jgi:hypothetical protein
MPALSKVEGPLAYLSWAIGESRRGAFFLFFLAVFVQAAARERAAEGLDDEEKQNDFS